MGPPSHLSPRIPIDQRDRERRMTPPTICYTYPQLLTQTAATSPGSYFNRHPGSRFNRREHRQLMRYYKQIKYIHITVAVLYVVKFFAEPFLGGKLG